MFFLVIGDIGL